MIENLKEKDRVIFQEGMLVREGTVTEISPSNIYVKMKYIYMGSVVEYWFKMENVVEILE